MTEAAGLDPWLARHLVCPRDHTPLAATGEHLVCRRGHAYPMVEGVPIMLLAEAPPTHAHCHNSIAAADDRAATAPGDVGVPTAGIDPFVQENVAATCGLMYLSMVRRLTAYPIPDIPLPPGAGERLLDVGCNWGRWSVSAARRGYLPVGIDPALDAVLAARRVARQLGLPAIHLVADARHLPFGPACFDRAFSYSVFLHLAKDDVRRALAELARVLKPGGRSLVQMPHKYGLRNLEVQARRGFREPTDPASFDTRYWTMAELRATFAAAIGPSRLRVDGYFFTSAGNWVAAGLPRRYRALLRLSAGLTRLSRVVPALAYLADSLYVESVREGPCT